MTAGKTMTVTGPGTDELVKSVTDTFLTIAASVKDFSAAAQAYAQKTVCELKILQDPEIANLRKEVTLMELRDKKSGLDKQRSRKERILAELDKKIAERQEQLGYKPSVKQDLKAGTHQVPPHRRDRTRPLTHRMEIPPEQPTTNAQPAQVEEQPTSAEAKPE